ncbi:hypothetical protein BDB01DRAFT_852666 [Pilobolus umbonatus]|nr:hypothetical protein BDB01DRAFT_235821 [Pilobolus umbonatus]KAI8978133.1 hypothetical protein BDB01DRAFT_852666 [Pilobolus umbonatus]
MGLFAIDLLILCYGRRLFPKSLLKGFIVFLHFFTPLIVICDTMVLNIIYITAPVLIATYGLFFPIEDLTLKLWFYQLFGTMYEIRKTPADLKMSISELRFWGAFKIFKTSLKFLIILKIIDPLLPAYAISALNGPWFSIESLLHYLFVG